MSTRQQLKDMLESAQGREAFESIFKEVTSKRSVTIKNSWMLCVKCKEKHDLDWKMFPEYEAYNLKDVNNFLSLMLTFGVGKPPEEKQVSVNITARRLTDATDEELDAIIEGNAQLSSGNARELPEG